MTGQGIRNQELEISRTQLLLTGYYLLVTTSEGIF